jgi:hypothetical protein
MIIKTPNHQQYRLSLQKLISFILELVYLSRKAHRPNRNMNLAIQMNSRLGLFMKQVSSKQFLYGAANLS